MRLVVAVVLALALVCLLVPVQGHAAQGGKRATLPEAAGVEHPVATQNPASESAETFKKLVPAKAAEAGDYEIACTLEDGFEARSSQFTFKMLITEGGTQVWVGNTHGELYYGDDEQMSSYVNIEREDASGFTFLVDMGPSPAPGDYTVKVVVKGECVWTCHFTYTPLPEGACVGYAVIDIEAFGLGLGFVEEPVEFPIIKDERASETLARFFDEYGYTQEYSNSLDNGYYLHTISSPDIDLSTVSEDMVEPTILKELEDHDEYFISDGYVRENALTQYDFTPGSSWMCSVNGTFPNVGLSDCYLGAGDVLRLQFTLAYGLDLGRTSMYSSQNPYYEVAAKDAAVAYLASIRSALNADAIYDDTQAARRIETLKSRLTKPTASQPDVDDALDSLRAYLNRSGGYPEISIPDSSMRIEAGDTAQLECTVTETDTLRPLHVVWRCDTPLVLPVDAQGKVWALGPGTGTATATLGPHSATVELEVVHRPLRGFKILPVTSVKNGMRNTDNIDMLQEDGSYTIKQGTVLYLCLRFDPVNATMVPGLECESSDTSVATVTTWGSGSSALVISPAKKGDADITVKVGDFVQTLRVHVVKGGIEGFGLYKDDDLQSDGRDGGRETTHLTLYANTSSTLDHGWLNVLPFPDRATYKKDAQKLVYAEVEDESLVWAKVCLNERDPANRVAFTTPTPTSADFYRLHVQAKGKVGSTRVFVHMGAYARTVYVDVKGGGDGVHFSYDEETIQTMSTTRSASEIKDAEPEDRTVYATTGSLQKEIRESMYQGFHFNGKPFYNRFIVPAVTENPARSLFIDGLKPTFETAARTLFTAADDPDGMFMSVDETMASAVPRYNYWWSCKMSKGYCLKRNRTGTAYVHAALSSDVMAADERSCFAVTVADEVVKLKGLAIGDGSGTVLARMNAGEDGQWERDEGETLNLVAGEARQLACETVPADATGAPVFYSDNQRCVRVDAKTGAIEAVGGGDAKVWLVYAGQAVCAQVHVDAAAECVSFAHGSAELGINESFDLGVQVHPALANTGEKLTWTSSAPGVARVDGNGVVRTFGGGEATITASLPNGQHATCYVRVDGNPARDLFFEEAPYTVAVDTEEDLLSDLRLRTTDGSLVEYDPASLTWSSSDESVAKVDANGTVTALKEGSCVITARMGTFTAKCELFAEHVLTDISLPEAIEIPANSQVWIQPYLEPANFNKMKTPNVTWTSSQESVVSIGVLSGVKPVYGDETHFSNMNNKTCAGITAHRPGTAVVTMTCGKWQSSCTVTVKRTAEQQAVYDMKKAIDTWVDTYPDPESPFIDHVAYVRGADAIAEQWQALDESLREQVGEYAELFEPELAHVEQLRAVAAAEAAIGALGEEASEQDVAAVRALVDALDGSTATVVNLATLERLKAIEKRMAGGKEPGEGEGTDTAPAKPETKPADEQGGQTPAASKDKAKAKAAAKVTALTINKKTVTAKTVAAALARAGASAKDIKKITLGSKVAKLKARALAACKKVGVLVLKTKKLARKSAVKGALKGSGVKTVVVKAKSGKARKKLVKTYRQVLVKKTCGKKVKVK